MKNEATAKEIRTWARENGIEVNSAGVVPSKVKDLFYQAQESVFEEIPDVGIADTQGRRGQCFCGCGQPVKKQYRPGHDAKHVSILLADLKVNSRVQGGAGDDEVLVELVKQSWESLPTPALRNKFVRAVRRAAELEHEKYARSLERGSDSYTSDWFTHHPDDFNALLGQKLGFN